MKTHLIKLGGISAVVPGSLSECFTSTVDSFPPPTHNGLGVNLTSYETLSLLGVGQGVESIMTVGEDKVYTLQIT